MTAGRPEDDAPTELRTLFITQAIKHRWRLVAVCTVLGLLAGAGYVLTSGGSRTATAQVLVNPIVGNPYSDQSTTNNSSVIVAMQTEAGVVGSGPVTAVVDQQLRLRLDPYPAGLATVVPDNTQIVNIAYTDTSADRARSVAQAYAQAYLARRATLARASQATSLARLNAVARGTQAALITAAKSASGPTPDPDAAARVQVYSSQLASVQTEIGNTESLDLNPGTLLTPATLAPASSTAKKATLVLAAALVGLVIGLILAAWRERRSDVMYADDGAGGGRLPVLGRFGSDGEDDQLRMVRVGLQLALDAPAVVAITPLSAGEPVGRLGLGLVTSLVRAGHAAVLVDARIDPGADGPRLPGGRGLSDAVRDGADRELLVQDVNGVPVLAGGLDPRGARDRYSGPPLGEVLGRLRGAYDYLVVLTAPADDAVGVSVAATTDAVLVAVTERHSRYGDVEALTRLLERGGTRVLGTLLLPGRGTTDQPAATAPEPGKPAKPAKPSRPAKATTAAKAATAPPADPVDADADADSASTAHSASTRPSGPGRRPTPRGRR